MKKTKDKMRSKQEEQKKQYHPPACASLELEFREDAERLIYKPEYVLNNKPNVADLLIIKEDHAILKSGLGAIFRTYNICEYKSSKDQLNERVYYRTVAYANLLASYDKEVQSLEEVTLTFIRQAKPVKLMKRFVEWGFSITEYEPGIYHVKKNGHMDMQIIVTGALAKKYKWITKLTDRVERVDLNDLLDEIEKLTDERDLLNAEAVFDLMARLNENKEWMKEVIGVGAFRDLFKEEFEKKDREIQNLSEQLQSKEKQLQNQSEQLQNQSEQLQNKEEQLQSKEKEVTILKEEVEKLKKQLGRIAML